MTGSEEASTSCYRHADKATGVICQRCDRFICSACMHQASVGWHCPECVSSGKQKVYTRSTLPGSDAVVTKALLALNAAAFVAQVLFDGATATGAGTSAQRWGLSGVLVDLTGEWWRLFTSGFVHIGIVHLLMNMYGLYRLGPELEQKLGPVRFAMAYIAALLGGSLAVVLFVPGRLVLGASGAIYGLGGLLVMLYRTRGIGLQQSGMTDVVIINVLINFSGAVSVAGHVGGLIIGLGLGAMYFGMNPGDQPLFGRDQTKPDLVTGALIIVLFVGGILAAQRAADVVFSLFF